jgi:hypothetical protein
MKSSPQNFEDNLKKIIAAWEEFAPGATFFGRTLAQFKAETAPCLTYRAEIKKKETEIGVLQNQRNDADAAANPVILGVVAGVKGDVNYGDDSALYELMGYVRKSERASGLHRKQTPPTQPPVQ